MTYSTLISKKSGSSKSSSNSRYHQLLRWCGERTFDGVIILDECHNAKTGTMTRAKGQKVSLSKTAQTVSILQAMKLSRGGLSFLEMLCCDIKAKGAFVSRQLSFQGCSFSIQEAAMSSEMESMYYKSVQIWKQMFTGFKEALDVFSTCPLRSSLRCRSPSTRRHDEWTTTWTMQWIRVKCD